MRVRRPFLRPSRTLCFSSSQFWAFSGKVRDILANLGANFAVSSPRSLILVSGPILVVVPLFLSRVGLTARASDFLLRRFLQLLRARVWETWGVFWNTSDAGGHTAPNTPDLFRTPKLTVAGPGQYWTGGPSGNTLGCRQLFRT